MSEPRFYLGRGAREQQRQHLETELQKLQDAERDWQAQQRQLRREREQLRQEIQKQEARLRWEERREEYATTQATVQREHGVVVTLDAQQKNVRLEGDTVRAA